MNVNDPIVVAIVVLVGGFLAWQMQRVVSKVDDMVVHQAKAGERETALASRVSTLEVTLATDRGRMEGVVATIHGRFDNLIRDLARSEHGRVHHDPTDDKV